MRKILLIGEINNTLDSIYKALLSNYLVQICNIELTEIEKLTKIVEPDLALISMYGMANFDAGILEFFDKSKVCIPLIFVGSFEECREYLYQYQDGRFNFVETPITQKELLKKCNQVIEMSEYGEKALTIAM